MTPSGSAAELRRTLGVGDAVIIGLGSMVGAGIFAALAPAARAAGSGLLLGLALAAVIAYCNAMSSARLAALYPASGGTYVYGRERLGPDLGRLGGHHFGVLVPLVGPDGSNAGTGRPAEERVFPELPHTGCLPRRGRSGTRNQMVGVEESLGSGPAGPGGMTTGAHLPPG